MAKLFDETNLPAWRKRYALNRTKGCAKHGLTPARFDRLCEELLRFHGVDGRQGGGHYRECKSDAVYRALWLTRVSAEAARHGLAAVEL